MKELVSPPEDMSELNKMYIEALESLGIPEERWDLMVEKEPKERKWILITQNRQNAISGDVLVQTCVDLLNQVSLVCLFSSTARFGNQRNPRDPHHYRNFAQSVSGKVPRPSWLPPNPANHALHRAESKSNPSRSAQAARSASDGSIDSQNARHANVASGCRGFCLHAASLRVPSTARHHAKDFHVSNDHLAELARSRAGAARYRRNDAVRAGEGAIPVDSLAAEHQSGY